MISSPRLGFSFLETKADDSTVDHLQPRVIATIESIDPQASAKGGESSLESLQREDVALLPYFTYLEQGILPTEDHVAKELVLTRDQYEILDGVLYHIEKDKTLRVIPPCSSRKKLFDEAHSGKFAGHLRSAKIHSLLSRHYWWKGMRRDIQNWCQACLTCAYKRRWESSPAPTHAYLSQWTL